jgi:hypothetical protein
MDSRLRPTRRSVALDRMKQILPVVAGPEPFLAPEISHRVACRSGRDKGTTGFTTCVMKYHRFGDGGVNPRYPGVFESVFAQQD